MKKTTMDLLKNILLVVLIAAVSILLYDKFTQKDSDQGGQPIQAAQVNQEYQGGQVADQGVQGNQEEQAVQAYTDNYLDITIDGVRYVMQLKKTEIYGRKIHANYVTYDPRGNELMRVKIQLPDDIGPGRYSSGNTSERIWIVIDEGSDNKLCYAITNKAVDLGVRVDQGELDLNIISRSADWLTYTGTFTATAIDTAGTKEMTVTNATFAFTIED